MTWKIRLNSDGTTTVHTHVPRIEPRHTPASVAAELVEIVADVCNCQAMWTQHPDAVTAAELVAIETRIVRYLNQLEHETA